MVSTKLMAKKSGTTKLAAKKLSAKKLSAKKTAGKGLSVADPAEVSTPQWLFDTCNDLAVEAGAPPLQVDAFASAWNAKLPTFWDTKVDALKQDWTAHKSIFCNPPWKKDVLAKCVEKAVEAAKTGTTTVLVMPQWHQSWTTKCDEHGQVHRVAGPVVFHRPDGSRWTMNNNKNTSNLLVVVLGPNVQPGPGATIRRRLSEAEQARLQELESKVAHWYEATVAAAEALFAIQTEGLYEAEYETFESYVEANWGRTRQWAYDMIAWHRVNLVAGTQSDPLAVSAARLLKNQIDDPELLCKILAEAKKLASSDRVTAENIAEAKQTVTGKKPAEKPKFVPLKTITTAVKHLTVLADWLDPERMAAEERKNLKPEVEELEKLIALLKQKMKPYWSEQGF